MRDYRRYPRLLQHDLGEPHAVGIAVHAPGQVTAVKVIPGQKPFAKPPSLKTGKQTGYGPLCPHALALLHALRYEWISYAHGAIQAAMFKVFRKDFGQSVVFGVSPKMGIIPREPVRRFAQ